MGTQSTNYLQLLLDEINRKRQEMIEVANNTGFTSRETIKCSQELDELINIYQRYGAVRDNNVLFKKFIKRVMLFFLLQKISYKTVNTQ
ncbi:aspartyl-phosphate phosphatase Spo0E family protein [Fredinandcohnia humi]